MRVYVRPRRSSRSSRRVEQRAELPRLLRHLVRRAHHPFRVQIEPLALCRLLSDHLLPHERPLPLPHRLSALLYALVHLVVVLEVSGFPREHVDVDVRHRLPRRGSVLYGVRERRRAEMRLDARPDPLGEGPQVRRLLRGQVREPRDDPPRDYQHVPGDHRLEVHEPERERRLAEDLRVRDVDGSELVRVRRGGRRGGPHGRGSGRRVGARGCRQDASSTGIDRAGTGGAEELRRAHVDAAKV
mmetsp:Transcript_3697/g.14908  ORF Transcript_3697/g.14908 Transcript_3697/m.14908 type:complete len:243 (-) Transcript_3697:9-737(-)